MVETMPGTLAGRAAGCVHHPGRTPIGRCAECGSPVCGECHIRLDGILHCRDCLGATEDTLRRRHPSIAPRIATAICAAVVLVPALVMALAVLRIFGIAACRVSRLGAVAFERVDTGGDGSGR